MNKKTFAATILFLVVLGIILADWFWYRTTSQPSPSQSTVQTGEMPLCKSPFAVVSNPTEDLMAINVGNQVDLGWSDQPQNTAYVSLARAKSSDGPWTEINGDVISVSLLSPNSLVLGTGKNNFTDIWVNGSANDFYYRLNALSAQKKILKTYEIIRVPKCQKI